MGDLTLQPRPPAPVPAPQSFGPRIPASPLPARRRSVPSAAAKPAWSADLMLAGVGLGLLLIGLGSNSLPAAARWIGVPTALGLTAYLLWPFIRRQQGPGSWQQQRDALLEEWEEVADQLSPAAGRRYASLQARVRRLGELFSQPEQGALLRPGEFVLWQYLKLLLARDHLDESVRTSDADQVIAQRDALLQELDDPALTAATRQSKQETVLILDQRVLTLRQRGGRIVEIESDLTRVEQWVALMCDQAAQHNTMGDAGRRLHFAPESLTLPSLESLPGSNLRSLDQRISSQSFG